MVSHSKKWCSCFLYAVSPQVGKGRGGKGKKGTARCGGAWCKEKRDSTQLILREG